jgi:hypothetical protein
MGNRLLANPDINTEEGSPGQLNDLAEMQKWETVRRCLIDLQAAIADETVALDLGHELIV